MPDADDHLANVLGALATAIDDAVTAAIEDATGLTGAAPAALIALHDLLAGRSVDDLRHAVDLTHSGAVRLVDRLVADGLATRRPGADRGPCRRPHRTRTPAGPGHARRPRHGPRRRARRPRPSGAPAAHAPGRADGHRGRAPPARPARHG